MKIVTAWAVAGLAALAAAQQSDVLIKITQGERVAIAVPDFRASGGAQKFMDAFNQTLFGDLDSSALFRMVPKSMYPLETPQRPQDFRPPVIPAMQPRRGAPPPEPVRMGPWLTDWSQPPVSATYLAFGYAGEQDGRLVIFGWLYNVTQNDLAGAQVLGKMYFGSLDEEGARKTAHDFASDILGLFGYKSLVGTKIYFESNRSGAREIWSMDPDGSNQKQLSFYKSLSSRPAVSPDGTMLAYTTDVKGGWTIRIQSLLTGGWLPFYNPAASLNAYPDFTPDGKRIVFSSNLNAKGGGGQLYIANVNGSDLQRLTFSGAIDTEPRVNPKTGAEIVFVSDRSGMPQVYKMSIDGTDVQRLTDGEGEAVNPAWHPDGQHIAFAWTRGYAPGHYNIFVMDVATRQYLQLTHDAGRNENPFWAPDGRHLVFSSNRDGGTQIWTMLADGTQPRKLTTQGTNMRPVWK
jgi:TolB protein